MALRSLDLMIGDWLYYKGQFNAFPFKVESITKEKVGYHAEPNDHRLYYIRLSECKPIPLTPEILEKNGWIKDGYFYKAEDGSYIQLGELFEHASFRAEKHGIPREIQTSPHLLKYIHQLQHALRLCGITGEIII